MNDALSVRTRIFNKTFDIELTNILHYTIELTLDKEYFLRIISILMFFE